MKYNFDEIIDYKGFENRKQLIPEQGFRIKDSIPMWIAEMDFRTCPTIIDALVKRVEHGVFGYPMSDISYDQSIQGWYEKRHKVKPKAKNINYHTGVNNGIIIILKALVHAHARVLTDNPVYHYFEYILKETGFENVRNDLSIEGNQYVRDMEVFEDNLKHVDAFLLCSPHNPGGRIWSKEELLEVVRLCKKHNVLLISDEIHSDLIMPHHTFTSMLQLDDDAIVVSSASKTFNLAGMHYAFSLTNNDEYAKDIKSYISRNDYGADSTLSRVAMRAAFEHGGEWLDQLNEYLYQNYIILKEMMEKELKEAVVFDLQASYLVWIDVGAYVNDAKVLKNLMFQEAKVIPSMGEDFGKGSHSYIRLNLATRRTVVEEAVSAICKVLNKNKK